MKSLSSIKSGSYLEIPSPKMEVYPGTEAFVQLNSITPSYGLLLESNFNRKIQKYKVQIEKLNYQSFMEISRWRMKTSLPLVKTYYTNVISERNGKVQLQVFNQHCQSRLSQLNILSLPNALYILKQSLIGFQRLFEKFGIFIPTQKMISINQNNRCKVWMNENYGINYLQSQIGQEQKVLKKIVQMIFSKVQKNSLSTIFYQQIQNAGKFVKMFKFIDFFAKNNKIKVPLKYDHTLKKVPSQNEGSLWKSKWISEKFRYSGNFTNQIQKRFHNKVDSIVDSGSMSNALTPRQHSPVSRMKESYGTTLSQTKRGQTIFKFARNPPLKNDTPLTPNRNVNSKRVKGDLFRSGSIDAEFLCANDDNCQDFTVFNSKQSLVVSKIFNIEILPQKYQKPLAKKSTMEDQYESIIVDIDPILLKNGWEKKVGDLMNHGTMKKSIVEGKQIRTDLSHIKLSKLDSYGGDVVRSILPDQIDL